MNFAEVRFWVLLITGLAIVLTLRVMMRGALGPRIEFYDKAALAALGLTMLLSVSWETFVIFLVVAIVSYSGMALLTSRPGPRRKRWLALLIPLQLGPLLYYKYANFLMNDVLSLNLPWFRSLVIPVGISFYTFQKVALVIDTLVWQKPLPRFLDYLNFACFFPQVVAGPIERRANLLPQMESFRFRWMPSNINDGAGWIALGLFFKCCLADNLAVHFEAAPTVNPFRIWQANALFGFRIYYDFAGYSLVALGLARCLGVQLTLNFLSPYCAASMVEFWRRWHVTLSQWFRDYVYMPMVPRGGGGVRTWAFNVAVVFLLSGVWHGAGWNFLLWGGLHGAYLIGNRLLGPRLHLPRPLAWAATMLVTFQAWLCFYETRPPVLWEKLRTLLTPGSYSLVALRDWISAWKSPNGAVLAAILFLTAGVLVVEWLSLARRNEPYALFRRPAVLAVLVGLTLLLAPGQQNAFIYFAF
jgi:D-alanyl-lipoteichoic acid acyltransferase DltB (MBOAT superfamily)